MDRGSKKRSRESSSSSSDHPKRGRKKAETAEAAPAPAADPSVNDEVTGIFEFPWQKEGHLATMDGDNGCDLRDVFFSSLVDGCRAAIGYPWDRLSLLPSPISLPDDTDGADCIWSCVLREPLPLPCVQ